MRMVHFIQVRMFTVNFYGMFLATTIPVLVLIVPLLVVGAVVQRWRKALHSCALAVAFLKFPSTTNSVM